MNIKTIQTIHLREITKVSLFDFFKDSPLEPRATDTIILFDVLRNFVDSKILELAAKNSLTDKGKVDAAQIKSDLSKFSKILNDEIYVIY